MPDIIPEYMGYDRTIAVFSPDGRLFQVEYAKETVKRGATALGITFKDGVVLATVKTVSKLMVSENFEKLFQIDDHIGAVAAGFLSDARVLVDMARIRAQIHRITFEEPIDVWDIGKVFGDRMQYSTLIAGLRPFGVSLLVGGVDKSGIHLIEADPSGMLFEWKAYSIGRGAVIVNKIFEQKWNENLDLVDTVKLAYDVINKAEKEKKENIIDIAVIERGKRFRKLSEDEIKKILK
jgi:proteasome alpha subunit